MSKIDFNKISKIYFIGIGGIGLSAIAKLMLSQGKKVSGSDANDSEILDDLRKMGGRIFIGQKAENLADDTELVIYTLAIPVHNPERLKAEKMALPMLTYPEALGVLFNDSASGRIGIAICGTHGKSTTTSMVSIVLSGAGLDPSVVVGSKVPEFNGNLRIGNSKYFIIEACEYERAFMEYWPKIIILNNIELDHTDYYKNIEDYRNAFEEFIGHLLADGVLILNGDDENISKIKNQKSKLQIKNKKIKRNMQGHPECSVAKSKDPADVAVINIIKTISFGFGENNDVQGYDLETVEGKTKFKVSYMDKELGEFTLKLPGIFNVYNALAAIATGVYLGIDAGKIKKSLAEFGGIWRRFEIKGEYNGAKIISDYAHHPTAVKSTLSAAREFYPGRRIVAVFQPHQHNRTKMLYQDFLESFDSADALILAEIFDVAGREEKKDQNVSSLKMVEDIKLRSKSLFSGVIARSRQQTATKQSLGISREFEIAAPRLGEARNDSKGVFLQLDSIFYTANLAETRKLIDEKVKAGDILLIMGAGDIYKVADELVMK